MLPGNKLAYNLQINVQDPPLEVIDVRRLSMSARLIDEQTNVDANVLTKRENSRTEQCTE